MHPDPRLRNAAPQCGLHHRGLTLVELLMALAVTAVLLLSFSGLVGRALQSQDTVQDKNKLTREADFAMQRMIRAVGHSRHLLLPLVDNPATNWPEHIREQTIPATPPIGDSTLATAVLAVTLPAYIDLDSDQVPDADNDGDGNIDEDPLVNMNEDGCPGICGVDDDTDGSIDEGGVDNDDEEGSNDEDWYDPLVYYLNAGVLYERTPTPWDTDSDSDVDGRDFSVSPIADNVTRFRVERLAQNGTNAQLVDIILELTSPVSGEVVSLNARVRLGGAL